jgi:hypothetical protein
LKTCLVRFDNNKYSVASRAVGSPIEIQAYADPRPRESRLRDRDGAPEIRPLAKKPGSHVTCMGLFLSSGCFWVLLPVLCSERERPFFIPSPAIRFPERAEGVKGPKR